MSSTSRERCFSTGSPKSRSGYMPPSYPVGPFRPAFGSAPERLRPGGDPRRSAGVPGSGRRRHRGPRVRRTAQPPTAPAPARGWRPRVRRSPDPGPSPPPATSASHGGCDRFRGAAQLGQTPEGREAEGLAARGLVRRRRASDRRAAPPARPRGRAGVSAGGAGCPPRSTRRRADGRPAPAARAPAPPPGPAGRAAPGRARGRRPGRPVRPTRCSTASVPMSTGTSGTPSVAASTEATSTRGSSAARSSRTRVMPGRTARNVLPWQCRHTSGRAVAHCAHTRLE